MAALQHWWSCQRCPGRLLEATGNRRPRRIAIINGAPAPFIQNPAYRLSAHAISSPSFSCFIPLLCRLWGAMPYLCRNWKIGCNLRKWTYRARTRVWIKTDRSEIKSQQGDHVAKACLKKNSLSSRTLSPLPLLTSRDLWQIAPHLSPNTWFKNPILCRWNRGKIS